VVAFSPILDLGSVTGCLADQPWVFRLGLDSLDQNSRLNWWIGSSRPV